MYYRSSVNEASVECTLRDVDGSVEFCVGGWIVAKMCSDGTVEWVSGIPEDNTAGIQVDVKGRVLRRF